MTYYKPRPFVVPVIIAPSPPLLTQGMRLEGNDGEVYTGDVKQAAEGSAVFLKHGQGRLEYADGNWKEGTWVNDKLEGRGTCCMFGNTYEGEWSGGKRSGKGSLQSYRGRSYEGMWKWGKKNGHGKQEALDGAYEGEFRDGKYHGHGTMTYSQARYVGGWVNGLREGVGKFMLQSDTEYQEFAGQYKKGTRCGNGKCVSRNLGTGTSTIYNGGWAEGEHSGHGTCEYYKDRGDTIVAEYTGEWARGSWNGEGRLRKHDQDYCGSFADNQKHGRGKVRYYDKGRNTTLVYEGEFDLGRYHGQGVQTYPGEQVIKGEFLNGVPNGEVVIKNTAKEFEYTGAVTNAMRNGYGKYDSAEYWYEGGWRNNREHGEGKKYYYNSKTTLEGLWLHGRLEGHGRKTAPDHRYDGTFRDGKFHGSGKLETLDSLYIGTFANGTKAGEGRFLRGDMTYEGGFKAGQPHGKGKRCFSNTGDIYEGQFLRGKANGCGTETARGGDAVYEGGFKDNMRHGHGVASVKLDSANGPKIDTFEGYWEGGKRHGKGVFTCEFSECPEKNSVVHGMWEHNVLQAVSYEERDSEVLSTQATGDGVVTVRFVDGKVVTGGRNQANQWCGECEFSYSDGASYRGTVVDGKRCGYGVEERVGSCYKGYFDASLFEGYGVLTKGRVIRDGQWHFGKFHGWGTETDNESGRRYEGEWTHGCREGAGVETVPDSYTFDGEWKGDTWCFGTLIKYGEHGQEVYRAKGTFVDKKLNGYAEVTTQRQKYRGNFRDDQRHGKGALLDDDFTHTGTFTCGTATGEGRREKYPSGDVLEGMFADGVLEGEGEIIKVLRTTGATGVLTGSFRNGKLHGEGTAVLGDTRYTGDWDDGEIKHGKIEFEDGTVYEGGIDSFQKHGEGKLNSLTLSYTGGWFRGKMHGEGLWEHKTHETRYKGWYRNGMRHGKGELSLRTKIINGTFVDDKTDGHCVIKSLLNDEVFSGICKGGKRHGGAVLETLDCTIHCTYVNDMREGPLHKAMRNGVSHFYGTYRNGKLEGEARWEFTSAEGHLQVTNGYMRADYWSTLPDSKLIISGTGS